MVPSLSRSLLIKVALVAILINLSGFFLITKTLYAVESEAWHYDVMNTLHAQSYYNLGYFKGGIYGKKLETTIFMSTVDEIAGWTELYWAMVQVLSEKYGCFMNKKLKRGNIVAFKCSDGRTVAFQSFRKDNLVYFRGRQYDEWGRLLHVEKHRVIKR